MPRPAGDPLAVKRSVPMSSHVGPSGYAVNNQGDELYDAESGSILDDDPFGTGCIQRQLEQ
eukprot:9032094-Karenia_brevis.AAC.1